MSRIHLGVIVVLVWCCAVPSLADVISFEGPASDYPSTPYMEDGFTVTAMGTTSKIYDDDGNSESELVMTDYGSASVVELTHSAGGAFSLHSLDVETFGKAGKFYYILFESDLGGSHKVTTSGKIDFDSSSVVADTALWDDVTKVKMTYYTSSSLSMISTIDSIDVTTAVPEPSSMALLWAAVGLGLVRRRTMHHDRCVTSSWA